MTILCNIYIYTPLEHLIAILGPTFPIFVIGIALSMEKIKLPPTNEISSINNAKLHFISALYFCLITIPIIKNFLQLNELVAINLIFFPYYLACIPLFTLTNSTIFKAFSQPLKIYIYFLLFLLCLLSIAQILPSGLPSENSSNFSNLRISISAFYGGRLPFFLFSTLSFFFWLLLKKNPSFTKWHTYSFLCGFLSGIILISSKVFAGGSVLALLLLAISFFFGLMFAIKNISNVDKANKYSPLNILAFLIHLPIVILFIIYLFHPLFLILKHPK